MTWTRRVGGTPKPQRREFAARELPLSKGIPGPWRTIIFDVSPERIRFLWKPNRDAEEELIAELVRVDGTRFDLFTTLPPRMDRRDVPPGWSPRLPLGIWAESAAVAFKNVVITPRP
jgi:hypothetical protein